jgi:putative two-component system response regulator
MDILVVDDEPIARCLLHRILSAEGYRVTLASDAEQALSLVKEQGHQFVVSDWKMPGMSGLDLCGAIRAAQLSRYVYFIMVTSNDRPIDRISGYTMGIDDYVSKPYNPSELLLRVNAGRRIVQLETSQLTIFALAKLAESRDPETGAHLDRVRNYCRVLAEELRSHPRFSDRIDDDFIDLMFRTSPLHDIGKVAVPDQILLKPGRLTKQEFDVMKAHTIRGAETIRSLLSEFPNVHFLRMAHDIILSHHEKYDGSGYPQGLAGENIPLCGRIMALADVYDALTSKRVYKDAFGHQESRDLIVRESGKHFDPDIVQAFLSREKEFLEILRSFSDAKAGAPHMRIAERVPVFA